MRPLLLAASLALFSFPAAAAPDAGVAAVQQNAGRALIDENCLYCHDDSYITSLNLGRGQWEEVLELMIGMGMPPLAPEVQERVLDYLETEHGPRGSSPPAGNAPAPGASAAGETADLPWAFPRYRPNPLIWRER